MLFPTFDFAIFFIIVFTVSWLLVRWTGWRQAFLLAASYFFYGYWDYRFLALLAASSAINYAAGIGLQKSETDRAKRWVVGVAVFLNLGILGFFKYYGFFLDSLTDILLAVGLQRDLPFLEIILPIGISFFTFQGISYVVDIYRGQIKPVKSPLELFLYISFFPQLVAGPIVRASHFLPQLSRKPVLTRTAVVFGFILIISGLFKKTFISHYIAVELVDPVFFDPVSFGSIDLLAAQYAYAVQVYCDFSGYSDIAIGCAALLGYQFRKNFDRPFSASSLAILWQRWHISLSTWLRDYLYRALRGPKRDKGWRVYKNIFLTMLLGGLWHGAAWTFIIWGAIHGAALVLERLVKSQYHAFLKRRQKAKPDADTVTLGSRLKGYAGFWVGWFFTFHIFSLATIFFRSPDMYTVEIYFSRLFAWEGDLELTTPFLFLLIFGPVLVQFLPSNLMERAAETLQKAGALTIGLFVGITLLLMEALGPEGVAPFIYFQF